MRAEHAAGTWLNLSSFPFLIGPTNRASRLDASQPSSGATDAELIRRSAEGDVQAFDEIVMRHGRFLLRVAARLLGDQLAAEDVVQDAMVRVWTRAHQFNETRARLRTWLYQIVFNLCIDRQRRTEPEAIPIDYDPIDPAPSADDRMQAEQRDAALARAIAALPVHHRAAIALVYEEGLSGGEAARVMGLSSKALERLLARARASLREQLQEQLHG